MNKLAKEVKMVLVHKTANGELPEDMTQLDILKVFEEAENRINNQNKSTMKTEANNKKRKVYNPEEKMLGFLNDLYAKTSNEHFIPINMFQLCRDHKVSGTTTTVMLNKKLIERRPVKGVRGRSSEYKWSTIKPNIRMASKLLDEMNKYQEEKKKERKEKLMNNTKDIDLNRADAIVVKRQVKEVEKNPVAVFKPETRNKKEETKVITKVSFLWGLYSKEVVEVK
jgi:hypothetical protein